ncbi:MerR family transcriptional regulator [Occultella aeris]|uniref:Multidrug-efflux transporter 1 regulator n=1 Tax=Occultella aeris TaxID=2761496 RepID=A0A7M4DRR2_9MICO|nr:MerR family transcriptional regulator [Occultella aeris]VZO40156.1 Multidrug-efflux transporter 1 regulator [Occultella aeris]
MTATDHFTIGEFARRTGLSLKALRGYDESGLLVPASVDPYTGYRYYSPAQEPTARRISLLRRLDMPLARVRAILAAQNPAAATDDLIAWWAEQERALATRRGTVEYLVEQWRDGATSPTFDVAARVVPERLLASITTHVLQTELMGTLNGSVSRIRDHLGTQEATFGDEWWAVFHGVVSPDSDGPIEVCVPYEGTAGPSGPIVIRLEPAGTEAATTITRAQCAYPQILHAYDAVGRWARAHGTVTRPPREVYPTPWPDTPSAPAAQIALPYREDHR